MAFDKVCKLLFLALICVYFPWTLLGIVEYSQNMFVVLQLMMLTLDATPELSNGLANIPGHLDDIHAVGSQSISAMASELISLLAMGIYITVAIYAPKQFIVAMPFMAINQIFKANDVSLRAFSLLDLCFLPACNFCKDFNPFDKVSLRPEGGRV